MPAREHALAVARAGLRAVDPEPLVATAVARILAERRDWFEAAKRIHVVGGGKAAPRMLAGLELALSEYRTKLTGSLAVPAGLSPKWASVEFHETRPAGVNLPTEAGIGPTRGMLHRLAAAGPGDLAIGLVSGGASALMPAPVCGVTLADKLAVTRHLQDAGASIEEVNRVRTALSEVKGGQLARAFAGRALFGLILSDIVGDPLPLIGSGPTVVAPLPLAEALDVLACHKLDREFPHVVEAIRHRQPTESPNPSAHVENVLVGNNHLALTAAAECARQLGYAVVNLGAFLTGPTEALAAHTVSLIRAVHRDGVPAPRPVCLLSGGESTVALPPNPGRGGRNTHFVLSVLTLLPPGVTAMVLSLGTDGEDGPTDAAGAVADARTLALGQSLGLDVADHLRRAASCDYFAQTGSLVKTGLTGTNVADVRVVLVV